MEVHFSKISIKVRCTYTFIYILVYVNTYIPIYIRYYACRSYDVGEQIICKSSVKREICTSLCGAFFVQCVTHAGKKTKLNHCYNLLDSPIHLAVLEDDYFIPHDLHKPSSLALSFSSSPLYWCLFLQCITKYTYAHIQNKASKKTDEEWSF